MALSSIAAVSTIFLLQIAQILRDIAHQRQK
jgi:hypothetical protein